MKKLVVEVRKSYTKIKFEFEYTEEAKAMDFFKTVIERAEQDEEPVTASISTEEE